MKNKIFYIRMFSLCLVVFLCLSGCGYNRNNGSTQEMTQLSDDSLDKDLKASDRAIVIRMNTSKQMMTFQTISSGARYDLNYTGTTDFADKYGQAISAEQLSLGEIVDVVLSLHSKTLVSLQIAGDTFTLSGVESYSYNQNKQMLSVGKDRYKADQNLVAVIGNEIGNMMDLDENDILTIKGIGRKVYAVTLEKGHGYLRLSGEESFQGGWVEIGSKIMKPISEDMLLLVPEGDYEMRITYHGFGGSKSVHIDRDKETLVDVSDLKGELLKTGMITFTITPPEAHLYLNGEDTDYSFPIELEYGVYQMDVKCEGYTSIRKYLSVGKENAEIQIEMDAKTDSSSSSSKSSSSSTTAQISSANNTVSSNINNQGKASSSSSTTSQSSTDSGDVLTTSPQLYIDSPDDVEVYFDAAYKGIAPLNFTKSAGTHVITLRRDGYVTKSYTITLENTQEDETYSFNDLQEDE